MVYNMSGRFLYIISLIAGVPFFPDLPGEGC